MIDGKCAVYRSANHYVISLINLELTIELERGNETSGPKYVERIHPLVRVHPVTRWKSLFVNRLMTVSIVGLDKPESDLILNYLFDVYEKHVDIQVRFRWTPGSSALWDNRITIHTVSWDYEGTEPRHGTRVTALAEKPFFDPKALTRREGLGFKSATVAGGV
jgi:alpha-ketoglutarate-dependent taurine dioxygenase